MILFKDISLSFLGNNLLENINFQLNSKEKVGLIGRNGSGKSTLFNLILNRIEPDEGHIIISNNYRIGILEQKIEFNHNYYPSNYPSTNYQLTNYPYYPSTNYTSTNYPVANYPYYPNGYYDFICHPINDILYNEPIY